MDEMSGVNTGDEPPKTPAALWSTRILLLCKGKRKKLVGRGHFCCFFGAFKRTRDPDILLPTACVLG